MNRILPASVAAVAVIGLLVALAAIFLDRERPEIVWSGKTLRVGYAEEYPTPFVTPRAGSPASPRRRPGSS
ncbi:hypothetical protein [Desulfolutivibrio sulfoxidireducens]|uniref:hypothetical protein n=1 Tax=Desulfolutivibrio sulfoxidireducens TaxID=2773299 RepID=UPI00210A437A|nr:hypothetical protein [Desulfolutivibrio sulfoxidireducens]